MPAVAKAGLRDQLSGLQKVILESQKKAGAANKVRLRTASRDIYPQAL